MFLTWNRTCMIHTWSCASILTPWKSYECWSMISWMILPLSLDSLGLSLINYYCSAYWSSLPHNLSVAAWIKKRFYYFCASIGFIGTWLRTASPKWVLAAGNLSMVSNTSKSRYLVCIKQHRSTKFLFSHSADIIMFSRTCQWLQFFTVGQVSISNSGECCTFQFLV